MIFSWKMRVSLTLWIAVAGCATLATPPLPSGFHLPAFTHVQRNWFAMPSDPVGTVVTRVHRDQSDSGVLYTLRSSDPPVPFQIDPVTGIVTVNDTLIDKENKTYSLWVIADDGSIPQTTEVIATITDQTGQTPRLPRPPNPFPPWGTTSNINFNFSSNLPPIPKPVNTSPRTTTTAKDEITAATEVTTKRQPHRPEDAPRSEDKGKGANKNTSNVSGVPEKEQSSFPMVVIPLVVVTALAAVVAAVTVFICKKNIESKKNSKKEEMAKESNGIVLNDASLSIWERQRAYSNRYEAWDNAHLQLSEETSITEKRPADEWEFPRHRLRIFNIVGEGAFGQVWRALAVDIDGKKGEQTVAVKTLKENASERERRDLLQELVVMKGLGSHPNVVRLVGCCTDKEPTLVIMEFVSLGKLQQFLRDSRAERHYGNVHGGSKFLTSRDLTHFAFQVARGMEFLASKGIIHRDLAARNVLITEGRACKVADFGFARDLGGDGVYERKSDGRLPIRWMAPESLYDDIFSVKSDVWSFGVLLWEIVTLGSTPYPGLSAGDVMKKVRDGHRLEKPEHCRRELYNIMYYCWEGEAAARPDFAECVTMLERLLATETDYIELERFPDHSYYNLQQVEGEKV